MVWNTIVHPKMMDGGASTGTIRPIKYVDTAKQNVYDMIIGMDYSGSGMPTFVLVHGDYETIYRMLMNDEFIRVTEVSVAVNPDGNKTQEYAAPVSHRIAVAPSDEMGTVNGKPVLAIVIMSVNGPNDFSNDHFFLASNNVLYADPKLIPVDGKKER